MINESELSRFKALFSGRQDAYGTGQGRWIKRTPTVREYREHVEGRGHGLGIAPLLDDGTVNFAAIDLDEPDFDTAREMQSYLPGTTWLEKSRSGNAHVWAFFSNPIDAWVARGILRESTVAVRKPTVEIFPKQDRLLEGMVGNYINLPLHGHTRPIQRQDAETEADWYDLETEAGEFINDAWESRNDPRDWEKRARWLGIDPPEQRERTSEFGEAKQLHICAEHIIANRDENPVVEGHRAVVFFSLAKQLLNYEGFDGDEAFHMMELVNDSSPDPIGEGELRRILGNAERGQFTSTGCDDPLFGPYAHPDCPIANPRRK